jgi:hypothetical protein
MKKMIIAATMMMTVAMSVSAQREVGSLTIQPKVGMQASGIGSNDKNLEIQKFGGATVGAELEYRMAKWFSLSAGAMYSREGGKTKVKDINVSQKVNLDYISAPVMANFYVWKGLALKAGIEPAFKVHEKYDLPTSTVINPEYRFEEAKNFNLRMPVGISYDFNGLTLDMRIAPSITKTMKHNDLHNAYAQLTVGYKFTLK